VPRSKTAKLRCPKCGQTFAMAMHLGRHMKSKHARSSKKSVKTQSGTGVPPAGVAERLEAMIVRLQADRQEHVRALTEIDAVFARLGIAPQMAKRRGRPPKAQAQAADRVIGAPAATKAGRRRKRRKFATSGTEAILAFVKGGGANGRTSAEINRQWKQEGRSGNAYVQIGQLAKAKKLKKEDLKGQRGTRYAIA
jgi:hypothetical protein